MFRFCHICHGHLRRLLGVMLRRIERLNGYSHFESAICDTGAGADGAVP
jgi:hypothetical protein